MSGIDGAIIVRGARDEYPQLEDLAAWAALGILLWQDGEGAWSSRAFNIAFVLS